MDDQSTKLLQNEIIQLFCILSTACLYSGYRHVERQYYLDPTLKVLDTCKQLKNLFFNAQQLIKRLQSYDVLQNKNQQLMITIKQFREQSYRLRLKIKKLDTNKSKRLSKLKLQNQNIQIKITTNKQEKTEQHYHCIEKQTSYFNDKINAHVQKEKKLNTELNIVKQQVIQFSSKIESLENQLKLKDSIILSHQQNQIKNQNLLQIFSEKNKNLRYQLKQCQQKLELKEKQIQNMKEQQKRFVECNQDQFLTKKQKQESQRQSQFQNQFQQMFKQQQREKVLIDFKSRSNQSICENQARIMQKIEYQGDKTRQMNKYQNNKTRQMIKSWMMKIYEKKLNQSSLKQLQPLQSQQSNNSSLRIIFKNQFQVQQYEQQILHKSKLKEQNQLSNNSSIQNQLNSQCNSSLELNIYPSQQYSEKSSSIN